MNVRSMQLSLNSFHAYGVLRWVFTSNVICGSVVLRFRTSILFKTRLSRSFIFDFRSLLCFASVGCHNPWYSGPRNTRKVGCSGHGRSSEASYNYHASFHVGEVGHNHALLGTEFSHATITLPNTLLIPSLSPPLGGTLLRHEASVYWTVEGRLIFKWVFLLFCPIPVYSFIF
jgi:hypothetical protein